MSTAVSAFPLKHSANAKGDFSLDFRSSDTGCEPMVSWEGVCFCTETFLPDFLHLRKAQPKGWQGCPPLPLSNPVSWKATLYNSSANVCSRSNVCYSLAFSRL